MKQFIHIPKTGGTSVRFMTIGNPDWDYASHRRKLMDEDVTQAVFVIRDPLDRFISAAKHVTAARSRRKEYGQGATNDFIENLRAGSLGHILFKPMTHWLGTVEEYKQNEHCVLAAVDINNVDAYFAGYGVEPQHQRDSQDYAIEFDDSITEENLALFKEHFAEDYALYNYITQQSYYVGN